MLPNVTSQSWPCGAKGCVCPQAALQPRNRACTPSFVGRHRCLPPPAARTIAAQTQHAPAAADHLAALYHETLAVSLWWVSERGKLAQ
jgi:hypothetical protein